MARQQMPFRVGLHIMLLAVAAITLVPMIWLIAATFKSSEDLNRYTFFPPPERLSTENIQKLFGAARLFEGDVKDWKKLHELLWASRGDKKPDAARRVWERFPPEAQEAVRRRRIAGLKAEERKKERERSKGAKPAAEAMCVHPDGTIEGLF